MKLSIFEHRFRAFMHLSTLFVLMLAVSTGGFTQKPVPAQKPVPRSPSDTVREFYRAMREKRFRDAFGISIYKPAIDSLSQAEFDDLRTDFEKLANNIPEKIQVSGEQISGEEATVFVKIADEDASTQPEPVTLLRRNGIWIVGESAAEQVVNANGREFFFKARIDAHHDEVQSMLQRIGIAQLAYAQQHGGQFGTLPSLIETGLVPKDIGATDSTGYRFHVELLKDGKGYTAGAEPAQYGRSGKLSFYMDSGGTKSADLGGKPLLSTAAKQ